MMEQPMDTSGYKTTDELMKAALNYVLVNAPPGVPERDLRGLRNAIESGGSHVYLTFERTPSGDYPEGRTPELQTQMTITIVPMGGTELDEEGNMISRGRLAAPVSFAGYGNMEPNLALQHAELMVEIAGFAKHLLAIFPQVITSVVATKNSTRSAARLRRPARSRVSSSMTRSRTTGRT